MNTAQASLERLLLEEGITLSHGGPEPLEALRQITPSSLDLLLLSHESATPESLLRAVGEEMERLRFRLSKEGRRPQLVPILLLSTTQESVALSAARLVSADDVLPLTSTHSNHQILVSRVRAYLALSARSQGRMGSTPVPRSPQVSPLPQGAQGEKRTEERVEHLPERLIRRLVHDLRNPLAGLSSNLGYLSERLLKTTELDQEIRETLEDCRVAVSRLRRTATMLLDLGSLEEGARAKRQATPLMALIQDVFSQRAHEAALRGQELQCDLSVDAMPLLDPELVQRMLHALLDQALRYGTAQSPVLVHVRPAGQGVRLRVIATGEWIPQADLVTQGVASRGVGAAELGLSMHYVVLVVRAHGGTLEIFSGAPDADGRTTASMVL